MSLKVWLPLNGNINNNGILPDGYISGSSLSYTTSSKLGKCLSSGTVNLNATGASKVFNNSEISIAFWIYPKSGGTSGLIFGNNDMSTANNRKFSIFQYPTINDLHWSWMNDTPSTTFTGGSLTGVLPSDKWTHVCITYKNPYGKTYINGNLVNEFTGVSNSSSFSYSTNIINSNSTRYINDLRIYDNYLSAKEVKEISKALILHYPLGNIDGFIGGRNLCVNSATFNFMSNTLGGFTGTISRIEDTDCACGKDTVITCTTTGTGFYSYPYASTPANGTVYSWSFWAKCSVNKSGSVGCERGGQKSISLTTTWKKFEHTFTANSSNYSAFTWYLNWNKGEILYIRDFKFEQPYITLWTPSPEEMPSLVDYTIYDVSGYRNNGMTTSTTCPSWSYDTVRNSGSYYFNNSSSIQTSNLNFAGLTNCSISFWAKIKTIDSYGWLPFCGQTLGHYIDASSKGTGAFYHSNAGTNIINYIDGIQATTPSNISAWHHYVILNVNLSSWTIFKINSYNGNTGWSSQMFYSDLRIYTTVLSEKDIKELYNAPISITDNGALMTQGEVIEKW